MHVTAVDCTIPANASAMGSAYLAYEHYLMTDDGSPPQCIYVGACKSVDLFKPSDAIKNSEWIKLTKGNKPIMIRVIGIGYEYGKVLNYAIAHMNRMPVKPVCNARGINLAGRARPIKCSNGEIYASQSAAANALNISQAAISQHMNGGRLLSVSGYTFKYADGPDADSDA